MVQRVNPVIRFLKRLPVRVLQVSISLTLRLDQCPHTIKPTAAPTFRITQLIICHLNNRSRTIFSNCLTQQMSIFPKIHLCFLCSSVTVHECWKKI